MLDGLRSHVCVDSYTNSYMFLMYQLSTPCEPLGGGCCLPIYRTARRKKTAFYNMIRGRLSVGPDPFGGAPDFAGRDMDVARQTLLDNDVTLVKFNNSSNKFNLF